MKIDLSHLKQFEKDHLSLSSEETYLLGHQIGLKLKGGEVFYLYGDLGAGKTTFVKGIVSGVSSYSPSEVSSPTFTFLHSYPGSIEVHHFDLYRMPCGEDFFQMGFDEFITLSSVTLIEWPEKISSLMRIPHIEIHYSFSGEEKRILTLKIKE